METFDDIKDLNIPEGYMYNLRLGKFRRFCFMFWRGIISGYPLCCVLRFSFEDALLDGKFIPINKCFSKRGSVEKGDKIYIPCNLFHHKTHSH